MAPVVTVVATATAEAAAALQAFRRLNGADVDVDDVDEDDGADQPTTNVDVVANRTSETRTTNLLSIMLLLHNNGK
jgi:hypothetical protein